MGRLTQIFLISLVAFLATGCGTMHIRTNQENADIYLDGKYLGTGSAKISSMGTPKTSVVRVEHKGQVAERRVKREFTVKTVLFGLFSYGTGLFWAWDFPDEVFVHMEKAPKEVIGGWGEPLGGDSWSQPMYKAKPQTKKPKQETKEVESTAKQKKEPASNVGSKTGTPDPWKKPIQ